MPVSTYLITQVSISNEKPPLRGYVLADDPEKLISRLNIVTL